MSHQGADKRILVGVDGSEASVEALRHAQHLATAVGAELDAVTCWEFPPIYEGFVEMEAGDFEKRARELLEESVAKAFGATVPENVVQHLLYGPPRQALIDASRKATMLVVGRRGHGGFPGLALGSVSSACVAHAECPVLVVHAPHHGADQLH
ncbi:universal stress protein [Sinomonas halotolerans]|uniref:Universal stress protein n=1 Tax=Sinomonas halotolerans TaxID=1644133 RepID=A0ABU9X228_9MICC